MGYVALALCGVLHVLSLPFLLAANTVLALVRYSNFAGVLCCRRLKYTVGGSVSPDFEILSNMLAEHCKKGRCLGTQFYGSWRGRTVVDLWARLDDSKWCRCLSSNCDGVISDANGEKYDGETLQLVWSASKIVTAVAIAIACDRGWLSYDDPIAKHWPEFASKHKGKDQVTVAHMLRHQGGMWTTDEPVGVEVIMDRELVRKKLEDEPLHDFGDRMYHMVCSGEVLHEVLRKVDPQHRHLGAFIRDEICEPLDLQLVLAVQYARATDLHLRLVRSTMGPNWKLRLMYSTLFSLICLLFTLFLPLLMLPIRIKGKTLKEWLSKWVDLTRCLAYGDKDTYAAKSFHFAGFRSLWNATEISAHPRIFEVGVAGASMASNARSMGRLAACLANWGELDSVRIISEAGVKSMLSKPEYGIMRGIGAFPTNFTQGGLDKRLIGNSGVEFDAAFGWVGWGGTVVAFNPFHNVATCFTSNSMTWDGTAPIVFLRKAIRIGIALNLEGEEHSTPSPISISHPPRASNSTPDSAQKNPRLSSQGVVSSTKARAVVLKKLAWV